MLIPFDIINYILNFNKVKCYICHKKYKINDSNFYYNKFFKSYFCSEECYNFI